MQKSCLFFFERNANLVKICKMRILQVRTKYVPFAINLAFILKNFQSENVGRKKLRHLADELKKKLNNWVHANL